MAKVRTILRPPMEGKNVTLAQARAAWRELMAEGRIPSPPVPAKKAPTRRKRAAKAE